MTITTFNNGDVLQSERRDGIWLARLNRPQKRNALTEELLGRLLELLKRISLDPEARALVLWGAGGHFCAGADVSALLALMDVACSAGDDPIVALNRKFGTVLAALEDLPVPTLAVVRGTAIGGGCGLAAVCSRVIAAEDATFSMPEVTIGVTPAQIAPFIVRRAGLARSRWLLIGGRVLSAQDSLTAGLADVIAPPAEIGALVQESLGGLLKSEPSAVRATLRIVSRSAQIPRETALDEGAVEFAALVRHGGVRDALKAAREHRSPQWQINVPALPEFT